RRQSEEERCFHSGYPSGRANVSLHRQDTHAPDSGRGHLHHAGVPVARVHADALECTVLLWWHLFVDYCSGGYGFHGSSASLHDVSPIRLAAQEGELQGRGLANAVRRTQWQKTTSYKCKERFSRTCPTLLFASSWRMVMWCWAIFRARCACITSGFCRVTRLQWSSRPMTCLAPELYSALNKRPG